MTFVSKHYGISAVGLKKVYKKLQIPTPWNGYWARIKANQKLKNPPLPKYNGPRQITLSHYEFTDEEKNEGNKHN